MTDRCRDGGATSPLAEALVEFCSDAWLCYARAVLEDLVAHAGPELAGISFSGCEVFTDPPENLRQNGENRTYWYFRVAQGVAVATREDRVDVDFRIVVDYRAALPKARALHTKVPVANGGERPPRFPPVLSLLFFELHNRLASVTA